MTLKQNTPDNFVKKLEKLLQCKQLFDSHKRENRFHVIIQLQISEYAHIKHNCIGRMRTWKKLLSVYNSIFTYKLVEAK